MPSTKPKMNPISSHKEFRDLCHETRKTYKMEPLPEYIKVTVFIDGLKVGPSCTQLFRVHTNTMEEAIEIALQEEYSHRQFRTPSSTLVGSLKKDADWVWERQHQDAFDNIKASLHQAPVLALPDESKSFSAICDASDYAIGCALLQKDDEGRERVISFQSRQPKAAGRNYPVHDKELLAMKYALIKFRVHLLGPWPFVIYTDHASLRTATNSPHLSQRMARCLSFFAEYNFRVEYKAGKLNVHSYQVDENYASTVRFLSEGKDAKINRLSLRQRAQLHRYELNDEDMKYDILLEAHDAPTSDMVDLAPVCDKVTGKQAAQLFLDNVFRYHVLPETILSDRDPHFTGAFWDTLFQLLGTKLTMSTTDHPQTDDQMEHVNRMLEDTIRKHLC
ncbi:Pol protein [Phytophthora palmivora]|uniref:Pol protein n=1 Tax=Phytophthora palmivora TaxID=4796 RepID=A0A2P4XLM6_9STRA|nr:Pol protein [Phytophthora palmivora]